MPWRSTVTGSDYLSAVGVRPRAVYLASILVMVSIFGLDLVDGSQIWLHVLYIFPIVASAFCCERIMLVALSVVLAGALQLLTLIAYHMPAWSIAANTFIQLASGAMIAIVARGTRSNIDKIEALSVTDELTSLPNRRGVELAVREEIARHRRYGDVFSLAVLDLDRFKELNDRRGHAAGDRALQLIAAVLRKSVRESDFVGRLGGDEFVIVMPDTQGAACAALCRSLSTVISRRMRMADFSITASIGFAAFEQAPVSVSIALQKADRAMYAVKASRSKSRAAHQIIELGRHSVRPAPLRR